MARTLRQPNSPLVSLRPPQEAPPRQTESGTGARGFGGKDGGTRKAPRASGKARRKRSSGLSAADWGPLGKHPDLEAIVARQRLHLPLSGRLTETEVTAAWKSAAAEHHPDRGGAHDTMQAVNGARDLLLGRGGE
jgi:hypothetical protein